MSKPLVIVESPAKARTLERFLGKSYAVMASVGHIRDLPQSAKEIPASIKDKPWATSRRTTWSPTTRRRMSRT